MFEQLQRILAGYVAPRAEEDTGGEEARRAKAAAEEEAARRAKAAAEEEARRAKAAAEAEEQRVRNELIKEYSAFLKAHLSHFTPEQRYELTLCASVEGNAPLIRSQLEVLRTQGFGSDPPPNFQPSYASLRDRLS